MHILDSAIYIGIYYINEEYGYNVVFRDVKL
jgi:hypothetical protein